mmetsp:Transcript_5434/g.17172  ORF Transcript_5434/g.17172 Transcript_5434/m.17172 type:complete len:224 (-) Transcript_5434:157-828(-)
MHSSSLHFSCSRYLSGYGHDLPNVPAFCVCEYTRCFVPPPHSFVHFDHAPKSPAQSLFWQNVVPVLSPKHFSVATCPLTYAHFDPVPFWGCVTINCRRRNPTPHSSSHAVHSSNLPIQFCGHSTPTLHFILDDTGGFGKTQSSSMLSSFSNSGSFIPPSIPHFTEHSPNSNALKMPLHGRFEDALGDATFPSLCVSTSAPLPSVPSEVSASKSSSFLPTPSAS